EPVAALEHPERAASASFGPDGGRVLVTCWESGAWLWDLSRSPPVPFRLGKGGMGAEFSPDGRRLFTLDWDDRRGSLWLWQGVETGSPSLVPTSAPLRADHSLFSPDGRLLATLSGKVARVWDSDTGRPVTPPLVCPEEPDDAAFSTDGRLLVTLGKLSGPRVRAPGSCVVWDTATGQPVTPTGPAAPAWPHLAFADPGLPFVRQFGGLGRLVPDDRPATDLVQLARVLSGRAIDEGGAVLPWSGDQALEEWARLRQRYPGSFALAPD